MNQQLRKMLKSSKNVINEVEYAGILALTTCNQVSKVFHNKGFRDMRT